MTEAAWGGKGLFDLHFRITVCHQWQSEQEPKQGRNLGAETDVQKSWRGAA